MTTPSHEDYQAFAADEGVKMGILKANHEKNAEPCQQTPGSAIRERALSGQERGGVSCRGPVRSGFYRAARVS